MVQAEIVALKEPGPQGVSTITETKRSRVRRWITYWVMIGDLSMAAFAIVFLFIKEKREFSQHKQSDSRRTNGTRWCW